MSYDAFISYSHAADGLLAPRLQAGLQRFAKPWWKRRAIRVFRDESSLSANPHLWSSITDALDASAWFVLLLSPEAAQSEWVNEEIEYWLEHKEPGRILPVVTEGEFVWNRQGAAAPSALAGVFAEEPRWVDLRFARSEEQLDLQNSDFRAAVADVASAVRGVAKDDLESEDVRQHRRTIRTAWAAGVALAALAVAGAVLAVVAIRSANEATQLAEAEADARADAVASAEEAQRLAEENQALAEQEENARKDAEANAAEAEAGRQRAETARLVTEAQVALDIDPELALLLIVEAMRAGGELGSAADSVLHEGLRNHSLRTTTFRPNSSGQGPGIAVDPSSDAFAISDNGGDVAVLSLDDASESLTIESPSGMPQPDFNRPTYSRDGSLLVATGSDGTTRVWNAGDLTIVETYPLTASAVDLGALGGGQTELSFDSSKILVIRHAERFTSVITVINRETGSISDSQTDQVNGAVFAPDGESFFIANFTAGVARIGTDFVDGKYPELWFSPEDAQTSDVVLSPDGSTVISVHWDGFVRIRNPETGEVLTELERNTTVRPEAVAVSNDGQSIAVGGSIGAVEVWDVPTGTVIAELRGHKGPVNDLEFSADGRLLVTSSSDGTVRTWSLDPADQSEVVTLTVPGQSFIANMDVDADGQTVAALARPGLIAAGLLLTWETDEWTVTDYGQHFGYGLALSRDAGLAVAQPSSVAPEGYDTAEPYVVTDLTDGGVISTASGLCSLPTDDCGPSARPYYDFSQTVDLSDDGTKYVAGGVAGVVGIFETSTGQRLAEVEQLGSTIMDAEFSPDGTMIAVAQAGGKIHVYDGTSYELLREIDPDGITGRVAWSPDSTTLAVGSFGGVVQIIDGELGVQSLTLEAHPAGVSALKFSSDGANLVTGGFDGEIKVWDTTDWVVTTLLAAHDGVVTGVSFLGDDRLISSSFDGTIRVFALGTHELVGLAQERVTRSFTDQECVDYAISPCPTLAEIRAAS